MSNCFILPRGVDPNSKPYSLIKHRLAKQLVLEGYAIWIRKHVIAQYVKDVPKPRGGMKSRDRYLSRLNEYPHGKPIFVQGGLTRTETKPAKLSPFSGARVGHQ